MRVTSYSDLQKNLDKTVEMMIKNHDPVLVEKNHQKFVMISWEDYIGQDETDYLNSSPENRKRLLEAVENVKNKNYQHHELLPDNDENDSF